MGTELAPIFLLGKNKTSRTESRIDPAARCGQPPWGQPAYPGYKTATPIGGVAIPGRCRGRLSSELYIRLTSGRTTHGDLFEALVWKLACAYLVIKSLLTERHSPQPDV